MSWFRSSPTPRTGVVIDIGSGSIAAAIVYSDPAERAPKLIWCKREHLTITNAESLTEVRKRLGAVILELFMKLESSGIPTLAASEYNSTIETLQVSISAPWSYTISKTVSFDAEEPFLINQTLIEELIDTAEAKVQAELTENQTIGQLGLEVVARATTDIVVNGYRVKQPKQQKVEKVSLAQISSVAQTSIISQVKEAHEKILPESTLEFYSFMLLFSCVVRRLVPDTSELCLIDITREATEIGIVRDGVLKYVTHVPFGSYALARELATALSTTNEEGFSFMKQGNEHQYTALTSSQKTEVDTILKKYRNELSELLRRTGDRLAIPKTVYLHCHQSIEDFFAEQTKEAAHATTGSNHTVHPITDALLALRGEDKHVDDTAIILSAHFFHKIQSCSEFEQA